jgi:hypothetical protein
MEQSRDEMDQEGENNDQGDGESCGISVELLGVEADLFKVRPPGENHQANLFIQHSCSLDANASVEKRTVNFGINGIQI